ncbi:MAG TPA: acid shock protein, partial [Candidatus Angelobacter sp.]
MKRILPLVLASSLGLTASALAVATPAMHDPIPTAPSQDRIIHDVRHELLLLPQFGIFDNLTYRVD